MHFVMFGAGAVGGAIGARLAIKGHPVTLIARGRHAEVIREKGLRYRDPTRDRQLQIPCVTHPSQVNWQADSVVIATMKAQDSAEAFETLYATVGDQYPLFCAQNGIANEALAQRYFSEVHAMLVVLPATYLTVGEVIHSAMTPGGLLDAWGVSPASKQNITRQVTSAFTESGFASESNPRTMALKHAKLLQNIGNALDLFLADRKHSREIMRLLREEALAVFQTAGQECASVEETRSRFNLVQRGDVEGAPRGGSSTWQSQARGLSSLETPFLNGEICQLARTNGLAAPVNALVMRWAFESTQEGANKKRASEQVLKALQTTQSEP